MRSDAVWTLLLASTAPIASVSTFVGQRVQVGTGRWDSAGGNDVRRASIQRGDGAAVAVVVDCDHAYGLRPTTAIRQSKSFSSSETRLRAAEPAPDPDDIRAPLTPVLRWHQRAASAVASSFVPRPFDPPPLLTNPHLQTIGGAFLRHRPECAYVMDSGGLGSGIGAAWDAVNGLSTQDKPDERTCDFWDERERISTPDGDFFHVDYKYVGGVTTVIAEEELRGGRPSPGARGMVMLLHGLESNSNSSLSTNIAAAYNRRGFDVACLNFRGCCGEDGDRMQLAGYHLGFTDDFKLMLDIYNQRWRRGGREDGREVYISGFSLGANVALKALGELGEKARTLYGVRGAAVTGAPFDNELNNLCVEAPGFNKLVYSTRFLKSMKGRLKEQIEDLCLVDESIGSEGGVNLDRCLSVDSIAEMESELIAPLYGFADNIDYYRKCSCLYYLEGVAVPTLIINAADDPFFDPTCWPVDKTVEGGGVAPIKMVRTDHGGHLGFMFHRPSDVEKREMMALAGREGWMPNELARFLNDVADAPMEMEMANMETHGAESGAKDVKERW